MKAVNSHPPLHGAVRTHREIAAMLGVSTRAVCQTEARALRKLRAALIRRGVVQPESEAPDG